MIDRVTFAHYVNGKFQNSVNLKSNHPLE